MNLQSPQSPPHHTTMNPLRITTFLGALAALGLPAAAQGGASDSRRGRSSDGVATASTGEAEIGWSDVGRSNVAGLLHEVSRWIISLQLARSNSSVSRQAASHQNKFSCGARRPFDLISPG